ncbi:Ca-activated chloride channel family protein [Cohnella sp. OV330]|uniref:vWA domain-containing protein n=1 Tax=Cohnella sp. OV330 TaxID=1855288 RepID=UPI0008F39CF8|nr:VWA domain-containing protein [Cohnella sp. OV330]SFB60662.1 Ca-activated chloride channel family protein [Cohnella sp. OV330]
MRQILLITDGCSNVGDSPAIAASIAQAEGISVNVVGIVDEGGIGEQGALEIAEIARAGGGMSRIVSPALLSRTVQMMTRQTVQGTIRGEVNRELRQIFGVDSAAELPPDKRAEIVRVMEDLGETAELRVALLIDASASMKPKMRAVEEAVRDLALSLQARRGESAVAVFHFPGDRSHEACLMDLDWTDRADRIGQIFGRISMKGTTPTGPALLRVVEFFRETCGKLETEPQQTAPERRDDTDGMRSDYVV